MFREDGTNTGEWAIQGIKPTGTPLSVSLWQSSSFLVSGLDCTIVLIVVIGETCETQNGYRRKTGQSRLLGIRLHGRG